MTVKRKTLVASFEARSVALLAAWTLGAASAAMAQNLPAPPSVAPSDAETSAAFNRADSNGDGQLSRAEAATLPSVAANFDQIDRNGDGRISAEEFAQAMKR